MSDIVIKEPDNSTGGDASTTAVDDEISKRKKCNETTNVDRIQQMHGGGTLGQGRILFRGQVFWQELPSDQVATKQLEFRMGLGEDKRNWARLQGDSWTYNDHKEGLADDDPLLISAAVTVPAREDEKEVAIAMRKAVAWGDHIKVRRLLARAFVSPDACKGALCEAAESGHEDIVRELLRAGAFPWSDDGPTKKTALHFACEQGHETIATLLVEAKADLAALDSHNRTACALARQNELGMMAKRLEKLQPAQALSAISLAGPKDDLLKVSASEPSYFTELLILGFMALACLMFLKKFRIFPRTMPKLQETLLHT